MNKDYRGTFWGDGNIPDLDVGVGHTSISLDKSQVAQLRLMYFPVMLSLLLSLSCLSPFPSTSSSPSDGLPFFLILIREFFY